MEDYDPPLLRALNNYGCSGLRNGIEGTAIAHLLNIKFANLALFLPRSDDVAMVDEGIERTNLSHSALRDFVLQDFNLANFGICPGSRVGVLVPNGPELAVLLIGLVSNWCAAPINSHMTLNEIKSELESTKCTAVIVLADDSRRESIAALTATLNLTALYLHPSPLVSGLFSLELIRSRDNISVISKRAHDLNCCTDIVLLLHTSGTGGKKKLVPYTLEMLLVGVGCIVSSWNLSPEDTCLNMMPLFHIGGIVRNVFSPILAGGSVIACRGFDPVLFWDLLQTKQFTWYYAAPTMHHALLLEASRRLTANTLNLPSVVKPIRFVANAAGGLLPALAESLKKVFQATILTSSGMTEW
jgi:acyl-coenzyme A synthetase/AMP-(fatty) acid ligase